MMETGTKLLWTAVMTDAITTATKELPSKKKSTYNIRSLEKTRAIRFFKNPDSGTLPFACAVLDLDTDKVSKAVMKKISQTG